MIEKIELDNGHYAEIHHDIDVDQPSRPFCRW